MQSSSSLVISRLGLPDGHVRAHACEDMCGLAREASTRRLVEQRRSDIVPKLLEILLFRHREIKTLESAYQTLQFAFLSEEGSNMRILSQVTPLTVAMSEQLSPLLQDYGLDTSCASLNYVKIAHSWSMPRNHFSETDSAKVCTEMAKGLRSDKFACLTLMQIEIDHPDGRSERTTNHQVIHRHVVSLLAEEEKKSSRLQRHQAICDASLLRIFLLGLANDHDLA